MSIISAIVLLWVMWFIVLMCIIPIGLTTQAEAGETAEGTPASAPVNPMIWKKAVQTTVVTLILWSATCAFILWSGVTVRDIDFFGRMGPAPEAVAPR